MKNGFITIKEEIIIGAIFVVAVLIAWYFIWHKKTDVPPYYVPSTVVIPSGILPQLSPTPTSSN